MIAVEAPAERAVLVAVTRKGSRDVNQVQEHLDELGRLVDTAGAQVVGRLSQQVASPNPATLLGGGKVEELRELVQSRNATLGMFDDELAAVQGANLGRELGRRVMERAEVILEVFSTRARSAGANLQVD